MTAEVGNEPRMSGHGWRRLGDAARFDVLVRASFSINLILAPLLLGGLLAPELKAETWVPAAFVTAQALLCIPLLNAGLDHYLGRGPRPNRLAVSTGAATLAGVVIGYLRYPDLAPGRQDGPATWILLVAVVVAAAGCSVLVRARTLTALTVLGGAAAYLLAVLQGAPEAGMSAALVLMLAVLAVAGGYRATAWSLWLVWQLERSRRTQADLAVAEERLRFARDLHDVVGRNLSAIALKAELAAQLARRGRESAIDEMVDVHRVAQDSLAELRAVVSGYRVADLAVELAGARSLLTSAGIECRVDGDGDRLPPPVQSAFGWVVREGSTNVLRHSDARTCRVTLHRAGPDTMTLTMENDGVPDGDGVHLGNGLAGLAERITELGGTLDAGPAGPRGFRLTARVPLRTAGVDGVADEEDLT